ncbi:MAG: sulfatase-like hydrolase/transferase [Chloroflexi bacterium]|nr:sulfatase-like hydrolase/transferase [Chloroflexota bacterium]
MKQGLSRRDFLKLAGLAPFGVIAPPLIKKIGLQRLMQGEKKNVLVVLFDAFSAKNISMYGYERETTPNLSKLAKRATVYHNHYASSSFTTPGTASLLTMTLPWTHRAFKFGGEVAKPMVNKSIFHAFDDYYRIGYSHNPLVNIFFKQFQTNIDEFVPREKLLINNDGLIRILFGNDEDIATISWSREMKRIEGTYPYSLFLSHLYEKYQENKIASYKDMYPDGVPNINSDNYYTLDEGIDWLQDRITELPQPFFSYFHFFPPHFPYRARREFSDVFVNDFWKPLEKPRGLFSEDNSEETLGKLRARYDQFILNVDSEFGRLFDYLESSGILENTWVVLTSDHGEMHERGISGHTTPTFYQPILRIPLMIFEPGQQVGREIHAPTSAIDVMSTLLHVTGHSMPAWSEGTLLPPYATQSTQPDAGVFAVGARHNNPNLAISEATIAYVQGNYKLIYYLGYKELGSDSEQIQLYDIQSDPEELNDLSLTQKAVASDMLAKVKSKLAEVNKQYPTS